MSPQYNKAPITEAVVDIRTELREEITAEDIGKLTFPGYPNRKERLIFQGAFRGGAQVASSAKQTVDGYIFSDVDSKKVVAARLDGFSLSRLAPYANWADLKGEVQKMWPVYRDQIKPVRIQRIAVRYMNRIDMPLPLNDLKDYLRTGPELSPDMSQLMSNFVMRVECPQPDIQGYLVLQEAPLPPPSPDVVSILLDIDLMRDTDLAIDDSTLWTLLDQLRDKKNQIFEACITPAARKLFEEEIAKCQD